MLAKKYREGDILTFANGMIGCVTKFDTIAVVDKSGWMTSPHNMPELYAYVANNPVIKVEHGFSYDEVMAA